MIVMMVVMGGGSDILGHLGGALFGFLFGFVAYPRTRSDTCRKARLVSMLTLSSLTILLLGLLFGLNRY